MPTPPEGLDSIDALLDHSPHTVTLFTLSWCGFCHAARNLLQALDIPHHIVELDSGPFAARERHEQLRRQLREMTGSHTLPQVFVGRVAVGGYTETAAASRTGELSKLLAEASQESRSSGDPSRPTEHTGEEDQ